MTNPSRWKTARAAVLVRNVDELARQHLVARTEHDDGGVQDRVGGVVRHLERDQRAARDRRVAPVDDGGIDLAALERGERSPDRDPRHDLRLEPRPEAERLQVPPGVHAGWHRRGIARRDAPDVRRRAGCRPRAPRGARSRLVMTTRRLDRRTTRDGFSARPAASTSCICAASALMKTSTGAPAMICRARLFDPPVFTSTRTPVSRSNMAASSPSASFRLDGGRHDQCLFGGARRGAAARPVVGATSRTTASGSRKRRRGMVNACAASLQPADRRSILTPVRLTALRRAAILKRRCVTWSIASTAITITARRAGRRRHAHEVVRTGVRRDDS